MLVRIFVIHAFDIRRLQEDIALQLGSPQGCSRVSCEVRVARPSRTNDDPPLLQVAKRAATDKRFCELRDIDRGADAGIEAEKFQSRLQSDAVHDGGEHADGITGRTLYTALCGVAPAPNVPSSDNNDNLYSLLCNRLNLLGQIHHTLMINTLLPFFGKCFAGEFQHDALIAHVATILSGKDCAAKGNRLNLA
ncbi:MAG: hypothetical protein UY85_C0022G0002 [Candidatus Peribacteria bacterium GW2011_GWB1_54_5]|nr:MAG: hypothetical protein UY85_C0022G0002 [Candidatus Peribacteria bacterium GW2011_GWB1_54_5]